MGYMVVTPAADSRVIYVSSSHGSNLNSGLSPDSPVQTLGAGVGLLRDGYADQMLLERGDVWHEGLGPWWKSGRSAQQPLVIGAYGIGARPMLDTGVADGFNPGSEHHPIVNNVVIEGIAFYADGHDPASPTYDPSSEPDCFSVTSQTTNLTIEDCSINDYRNGITMVETRGPISNVTIRGCVVTNSYSSLGAHSEGTFLDGVSNILLQDNDYDHNGWNAAVHGANATIFNHDVYVSARSRGLVAVNNIFANAGSHGLQARCGGIVKNNVFINDPTGLSFGLVNGSAPTRGGVTGQVVGNLFIGSRDIDPANPRGVGLELGNTTSVTVADNLFCDYPNGTMPAIQLEYGSDTTPTDGAVGLNNVVIRDNVIYNWGHGLWTAAGLRPGTGGPKSLNNLTIINNDFQQITSGDLVMQGGVLNTSQERWVGNRYSISGSSATSTYINHVYYPLSYWLNNIDRTGAQTRVGYANPAATIASYDAAIGRVGTGTDLLAAAALQSSQSYNPVYSATAILDYMSSAFSGGRDGLLLH